MKGFPDMFDIQCHHCEQIFADEKKYSAHLKQVAKKEEEKREYESRPLPLWDEPTFHCSKCLKTFASDNSYKAHLRSVHRMSAKYHKNLQIAQKTNSQNNEVVDAENANKDHFFCFACRRDFYDKLEFDQHLKEKHNLNLTMSSIDSLKIAPSPPVFAKPLDPTLYYFMMKDIGQAHSH